MSENILMAKIQLKTKAAKLLRLLVIAAMFCSSLADTGKSMADDINLDIPRFKTGDCLEYKAPMSEISSVVKIERLNKITFRGETVHIYVISEGGQEISMQTWQFDVGKAKKFNCKDFLKVKAQIDLRNKAAREHRERLEAEGSTSSQMDGVPNQSAATSDDSDSPNRDEATNNQRNDEPTQKQNKEELSAATKGNPKLNEMQWLLDDLNLWIKKLPKIYPKSLRESGVQGKVVMGAILDRNGAMHDFEIEKSSGNHALDKAALEDARDGAPIMLSRPLPKDQMKVRFSIDYALSLGR